jgi:alkaline phosphatase D
MSLTFKTGRRRFVLRGGVWLAATASDWRWPRTTRAAGARPELQQGIQIGDVVGDRAMIWARADRPARLVVEWSLDEQLRHAHRLRGPYALEDTDFTARLDLTDLPADQTVFVRATFETLSSKAEPWPSVIGHFRSAPAKHRDVRFLWAGDTVGQGYGINPDVGGMTIYETMRARQPDFFIHSGDTIYADGPVPAQQTCEEGKIWRNLVTEEKSKVAETLAEFRGHHRYNFLDENLRRFNAEVPQVWQWDDHEVFNNYSDSADLGADTRYREKNVQLLAARGQRAFLEYAPLRYNAADESERVYRHIPYGPLLDVFVLDMRGYRGPNSFNRQAKAGADTAFLGSPQLRWLQRGLARSRALWKVIAADMPLGLLVRDGKDSAGRDRFDATANGSGPAQGRELELAELLRSMKRDRISDVIWLTADVHYAAAHYYDPAKAKFRDFDPFWEFVAGPLNAGSFGPNDPDDTFGMQVVFQRSAPVMNASPLAGYQFFGEVNISSQDHSLTVLLRDKLGSEVFTKKLSASEQASDTR